MSVLPDYKIRRRGDSLVQPFLDEAVQPASIDLRLGESFLVFDNHHTTAIDLDDPADITKVVRVELGDAFVLHPGEFVLGVTHERVMLPNNLVARIEGKSSLGRLGLIVHATAGFIDPGYQGRLTLEMTNLLRVPILLRPGKWICQVSFQEMLPPEKPYQGRYQGDEDVAASRYGESVGMLATERFMRSIPNIGTITPEVLEEWARIVGEMRPLHDWEKAPTISFVHTDEIQPEGYYICPEQSRVDAPHPDCRAHESKRQIPVTPEEDEAWQERGPVPRRDR